MADQKIELTVRVNSDTGGIDVVGSKLKDLEEKAKGTGKSFLGLTGTSASLVKEFLPFVTVVGGATFAISKFTGFITSAVKESESFRETLTRMRSAVETTGGSWDKSGKAIEDWAQTIQRATRFSDNQALAALDRLTRATGNLAIAQKGTTLAMDISVKTGQDFNSVTDLVTRMILGQNRALLEAQKQFGNVLAGAKDNKEALEKLASAYEGAAISERSLTSESAKLNNEWEDLKKNVGNAVTPALLTLTETLNNLFPTISKVGIVLRSYFTKGAIGSIVDFKEITAAFSVIDSEAKKAAHSVEDLKNNAGGLGNALKGYTPPSIGEDKDGDKKLNKLEDAKKASNDRLAELEDELNVRMAQLNDGSVTGKIEALRAQELAETNKIRKEVGNETAKEARIAQIRGIYRKKEETALQEDAKFKAGIALDAASTAISALQMINNASEINSKNDARRAKLLLALQQSITIANIWASNTKLGPWGVAKSIAETGLAVAAFAVQSKAIDNARRANEQELSSTSISQDLGNGTIITDTFSDYNSGTTQSGGVGGSGGGGGSFGVSGGGGGAGTIINIGPTSVSFSAGSVDLSNIDLIARRLGESVTRGNVEAAQAALAFYRSGQKQDGLAR